MSSLPLENWKKIIENHTIEGWERNYWLYLLEGFVAHHVNTWDFQVQFCAWRYNQFNVVPSNNLITNVGIRADATHTVSSSHSILCNPSMSLPEPFPEQELRVDCEMDSVAFIRKLFALEAVMQFLFRSRDKTYSELTEQKQDLVATNRELTVIAENQHK